MVIKSIRKWTQQGFTLIEIILVLIVVSIIITYALTAMQQEAQNIRVDRATLQIQQILNAGLSYYVNNGQWPCSNNLNTSSSGGTPTVCNTTPGSDCSASAGTTTSFAIQNLINTQFLSANNAAQNNQSPFYKAYYCAGPTTGQGASGSATYIAPGNQFFVALDLSNSSLGSTATASVVTIMGRLPNAFVYASGTIPNNATPAPSITATTTTAVYAAVNVPAQSLNQTGTVSFAGLYYNGACVPAPQCPPGNTGGNPSWIPEIYVVPASVNGLATWSTDTVGTPKAYPISGFTAFATGAPGTGANAGYPVVANAVPSCSTPATVPGCGSTVTSTTQLYWRVCLAISTEQGNVSGGPTGGIGTVSATTNGPQAGFVLAITRCRPVGENEGSGFSIWGNYPLAPST